MEFDIEDVGALRRYLTQHQHIKPGQAVSFTTLLGGVSNRTVRIAWEDGHAWVLKQALAKLRVKEDWFSSPERIRVEAKGLRWLNQLAPSGTTPSFVFEDLENYLMAMEAIPEEHENWKSLLLAGQIVSDHFVQFASLLGTIHRRSAESGPDIRKEFADTSFFESLRLEPYYLYTAGRVSEAASFLHALAQDTMRSKLSLVHGDYSPKNTLLYRGKLVLLDYEVIHFGDPGFDVGFAMTHFLSKAHHLPRQRTALANAASLFWRIYFKEVEPLGWDGLEARSVRHTLGCMLARVAGKSPLEYLTPEEAARQRRVVLRIMGRAPTSGSDLIGEFVREIEIRP